MSKTATASKPAAKTASKPAGSAILESARAATTPVPVDSAAVATPVVEESEPEFDWSTVEAPTVSVYTRVAAKNVEETTPERIKAWVSGAFEETAKKGEPVYFTLNLDTPERVLEFLKLAKRYAAFKGYTMRGGANAQIPTQVRYAVKVREVRKAKPVV